VLRRVKPTQGIRGDRIGVEYGIHVGGFDLTVNGLAFQQQDQGVSACATTALWTALHQMAELESLRIPTPAFLTEAACRYYLPGGRALPQEGLTLEQICEACRAAGLSPVVLHGLDTEQTRAQIHVLLRSGFPALLGLFPVGAGDGHAVTVTGFAEEPVAAADSASEPALDLTKGTHQLFVHDDRLGPDAVATLEAIDVELRNGRFRPVTDASDPQSVMTVPALRILRRDGTEFDKRVIRAIIVAVPSKVRLSLGRLRQLGWILGRSIALGVVPDLAGRIGFSCYFERSTDVIRLITADGLSANGAYTLACQTALSRYVARVALSESGKPLFDVLLDSTETEANPSVLAFICRRTLPSTAINHARQLASHFGVDLII
jgi:hypothetical protein